MSKRVWITASMASIAALAAAFAFGLAPYKTNAGVAQQAYAQGYVFNDANSNGKRDSGERGLAGVRVSDQSAIVLTDRNGHWQIPLEQDQDTRYFVIKPRGWMTPVDGDKIPQFYYNYKPAGSPATRYPGVPPTGPLPASIDFPLVASKEPDKFTALFFGDTQPRDVREVEYIQHDVVEPLIGNHDSEFGVTLGDIVFDDLSVFEPLVKSIALIGIPWYYVIGNHDINYDSPDDEHSDETYERWFGPNYYSWEHGPVHFVTLDNIHWQINTETKRGAYKGFFGPKQLDWLKKDLALVPDKQLVVIMMHIPVTGCEDRQELYRIIEKRPYVISVAAHTHFQEHVFINSDAGWHGAKPHHHIVNVTVCGSWWQGSPDEFGIPNATMRCGAPNGYAVFRFDGNQYSIEFRAARRPASYQMEIYAPDTLALADAPGTEVLVNVFGGSERSKVEMRFGNGPWMPMRKVEKPDPAYRAMYDHDKDLKLPYRPLPEPINSPHLWQGVIPANAQKGMTPIHVRTTDMFGQTYFASRGVLIQ